MRLLYIYPPRVLCYSFSNEPMILHKINGLFYDTAIEQDIREVMIDFPNINLK